MRIGVMRSPSISLPRPTSAYSSDGSIQPFCDVHSGGSIPRFVSSDIELNTPNRSVLTISAIWTIGIASVAPLLLPLVLASVKVDKDASVAIRIERAPPSAFRILDVVCKLALQLC
jgi:hypothetical protein